MFINNVLVADHWYDGAYAVERTFYLESVPAGATWPIRLESGDKLWGAALSLTWQVPGQGFTAIPAANVNPGYGLATTATTVDSGGGIICDHYYLR